MRENLSTSRGLNLSTTPRLAFLPFRFFLNEIVDVHLPLPMAVHDLGGAGPGVLNLSRVLTPARALGDAVSGTPKIPRSCGGTDFWLTSSAISRFFAAASGPSILRNSLSFSFTVDTRPTSLEPLGLGFDDGPWCCLRLKVCFLGIQVVACGHNGKVNVEYVPSRLRTDVYSNV